MTVRARCSRCHEYFDTDGTVPVLWPPDGRYPHAGAVCSIVCTACTLPTDRIATVNIPTTEEHV